MNSPLHLLLRPRSGAAVAASIGSIAILNAAGRWERWLGTWRDTSAVMDSALILGLPATATCAAWVSAGSRRNGMTELAKGAVNPARSFWGLMALEIWGFASLGFLLAAATTFGLTGRVATYGRPPLLSLGADVAWLALGVVVGVGFGRVLPWFVAPPAAGVLIYVLLAVFVIGAPGLLASLTPIDDRWATFTRVHPWIPVFKTVLPSLLALALVFAYAKATRPAVTAAWVAGLVAAPLLLGGADTDVDRSAVSLGCSAYNHGLEICTPRAKSYLRDDLARVTSEVRHLTGRLSPSHLTLIDDEARGLSPSGDAELAIATGRRQRHERVMLMSKVNDQSASTQVQRSELVIGLAQSLFPSDRNASQAGPSDILMRWLLTRLQIPIDGSAAPGAPSLVEPTISFSPEARRSLKWFASLEPQVRAEWFEAHAKDISSTSLTWQDFR